MMKVLVEYVLAVERVSFDMKEYSIIASIIFMTFRVIRVLAKARLTIVAK